MSASLGEFILNGKLHTPADSVKEQQNDADGEWDGWKAARCQPYAQQCAHGLICVRHISIVRQQPASDRSANTQPGLPLAADDNRAILNV